MPKFEKRQLASDQPLGEQLRAVRQTAKLSLDQVATATKIRKPFIQALEKGDYEAFPAEVYLRGFLENYAAFLGFPADDVLQQYKRERGITNPPKPKLEIPQARAAREQRLSITPRTIWLGLGALSLLIAVSYIVTQLLGLASPPKLEVFAPVANATVSTETIDVEGRTDTGAELSINNQPVPTDPDGGFKEQVRVLAGNNSLRIVAKNKSGREKVLNRQVVANLPNQPSPSPTTAPSGLLVTVKIGPNSAFVTVNVDGKQAFQGLLLANTEQTFVATSRVLLSTSNGGSTRVLLGGQDQGPTGKEGQTRRGIEYLAPTPAPVPAR